MSCSIYCYAECRYAECRYAECRYAECHYAECGYTECHWAECRYAECRGALNHSMNVDKKFFLLKLPFNLPFQFLINAGACLEETNIIKQL